MEEMLEGPRQTISEANRRDILDFMSAGSVRWSGRLDEVAFLERLWDLTQIRSHDYRFPDVAGDIWQHRVNNPEDWPDDWVFHDARFNLLRCPDDTFCRFLTETLHPVVRTDLT